MRKKILLVSCIIVIVASLICILAACGGDTPSQIKQAPIFQGMTLSKNIVTDLQTSNATTTNSTDNMLSGDIVGRIDNINTEDPFGNNNANPIENHLESELAGGNTNNLFSTNVNEDFYITFHFLNPDNFDIISIKINDKTYAPFTYEKESNKENIIIKVNENRAGVKNYHINGIKYNDNSSLKDVIYVGDIDVKVGIYGDNIIKPTISSMELKMDGIDCNINVQDDTGLLEVNSTELNFFIYDGNTILKKTSLNTGANIISISGLAPHTLYQYAIAGKYNDLSGETDLHVLKKGAFYTKDAVLFKDIVVEDSSVNWNYQWNEQIINKEIKSITLYMNNEKTIINNDALKFDNLKPNTSYSIVMDYMIEDKLNSIRFDFKTIKQKPVYLGISFSKTIGSSTNVLNRENLAANNGVANSLEDEAENIIEGGNIQGDLFYVNKGETFYITIKLHNPEKFDILSLMINDKIYYNYSFDSSSNCENIIIKLIAEESGIKTFTISNIKYVDNSSVEEVKLSDNTTAKVGIHESNMVKSRITNKALHPNGIDLIIEVIDQYKILEANSAKLYAVVYDGKTILQKQTLNLGDNTINFKGLMPNTIYEYAVVGKYNDLSGNVATLNVLIREPFTTEQVVSIKDIIAEDHSVSWNYQWNEEIIDKEIVSVKLCEGINEVLIDNQSMKADKLLSSTEYKLIVKYLYEGKTYTNESIFTTLDDQFKVGLLCLHDYNSTYDKNFIDAMYKAVDELGLARTQLVIKTGVPETNECYDTCVDLINIGCDVIFGDIYGHDSFMEQAAKDFPNIEFCQATGVKAHTSSLPNYHNAFAAIYEGRYLAGIAAGMKLKEMGETKMGYVGAFPYAEVVSGYTAFFLGAKSIVPEVTMDVKFTGSWYDETAERQTALSLIQGGCKLISQHSDSMGAPNACKEMNIPNVTYNISSKSECPQTYLTGTKINWVPYFKYIITKTLKGQNIATDWVGTIGMDSVQMLEINDEVAAAGTREAIDAAKIKLGDGTLKVFDCAKFTVDGKHLTEYMADVNPDAKFAVDTNVVKTANGITYIAESEFRSAPYFNITEIDGIRAFYYEYY